MEPGVIAAVCVGGVLALILLCVLVARTRAGKRRDGMARKAVERGFAFAERNPDAIPAGNRLGLFTGALEAHPRNVMRTPLGEADVRLFDYVYWTGPAWTLHLRPLWPVLVRVTSMQKRAHTVALARVPGLDVPHFSLRPTEVLSRGGVGWVATGTQMHVCPWFAEHYELKAEDPAAVRAAFTRDVEHYFDTKKELCVEAAGDLIAVYRLGKAIEPRQVPLLMEEVEEVIGLFPAGPAPAGDEA